MSAACRRCQPLSEVGQLPPDAETADCCCIVQCAAPECRPTVGPSEGPLVLTRLSEQLVCVVPETYPGWRDYAIRVVYADKGQWMLLDPHGRAFAPAAGRANRDRPAVYSHSEALMHAKELAQTRQVNGITGEQYMRYWNTVTRAAV